MKFKKFKERLRINDIGMEDSECLFKYRQGRFLIEIDGTNKKIRELSTSPYYLTLPS